MRNLAENIERRLEDSLPDIASRLARRSLSESKRRGITMIMGIAIFGSLTAVITSLVLEPAKDANDPILAKLDKIEAELAKLRSRLEES